MIRVTKTNKCPICDHGDFCYFNDSMTMVFCMRVESQLKSKNGANIHILKDTPRSERAYTPPPPTRLKKLDLEKYHERLRAEWDHIWADGTAMSIGVDEEALERLSPGWDCFNKAVGFPMRDAEGKVIGIRLRNWKAQKWAVSGSSDGLFFDPTMELGEDKEIVICEGPTDTAAGLTLGLFCVGRSSCQTGTDLLRSLCKRLGTRLITIVSDNDGYKECGDSLRRPGIDGAIALGKSIGRMYRIVVPPKKDLRQWLAEGLTLRDFRKFADVSLKRMG